MPHESSSPGRFELIRLGFIATTGFSMMLVLPVALGGMADLLHFSDADIGWVAAFNSFGIALGALYVSLAGARFRPEAFIRLSLMGLLVADLLSARAGTPGAFFLLRGLAGVFGGIIYAGVLRAMAGLSEPGKGYSIYVMVYCAWAGVLFYLAPHVLEGFELTGLFLLLAGSSLLALLLTPVLRGYQVKVTTLSAGALRHLLRRRPVAASLLSYLLLMAGCGAVWAYVERMGNDGGLSAAFIGGALSTSNLAGILAGLLVYRVGEGRGVTGPIAAGIFALAASAWLIGYLPRPAVFFGAVFVISGAWAFLIAYFQKVQALVDPAGKIVALGATINLLGRAIGPGTVSFFLVRGDYHPVVWYALAAFAACFLVAWPALAAIDRGRGRLKVQE